MTTADIVEIVLSTILITTAAMVLLEICINLINRQKARKQVAADLANEMMMGRSEGIDRVIAPQSTSTISHAPAQEIHSFNQLSPNSNHLSQATQSQLLRVFQAVERANIVPGAITSPAINQEYINSFSSIQDPTELSRRSQALINNLTIGNTSASVGGLINNLTIGNTNASAGSKTHGHRAETYNRKPVVETKKPDTKSAMQYIQLGDE